MKHIKMVLYGEPGVGKSVFASKAPRPFFITTDGNYEFLEDFGAKEEDHIQVNNWAEAKKALSEKYDNYDTIVIDLAEDLFKWCEYEFCKKNGYEHVSDLGYGKGYDITRNDYFINICKILNLPKNVILIMHGITNVVKDRRGIEYSKHMPTNRLPDKVLDMIEGRVKYFLRAYVKGEEIHGKLIKKRYLSLVPKENEYGILRGIDENILPSDIPLDFDIFAETIGLNLNKKEEISKNKIVEDNKELVNNEKTTLNENIEKPSKEIIKKEVEEKLSSLVEEKLVNEELPWENSEEKAILENNDKDSKESKIDENNSEEIKEEPKKELTRAEKIAAIQARLLAMQNRK